MSQGVNYISGVWFHYPDLAIAQCAAAELSTAPQIVFKKVPRSARVVRSAGRGGGSLFPLHCGPKGYRVLLAHNDRWKDFP